MADVVIAVGWLVEQAAQCWPICRSCNRAFLMDGQNRYQR